MSAALNRVMHGGRTSPTLRAARLTAYKRAEAAFSEYTTDDGEKVAELDDRCQAILSAPSIREAQEMAEAIKRETTR